LSECSNCASVALDRSCARAHRPHVAHNARDRTHLLRDVDGVLFAEAHRHSVVVQRANALELRVLCITMSVRARKRLHVTHHTRTLATAASNFSMSANVRSSSARALLKILLHIFTPIGLPHFNTLAHAPIRVIANQIHRTNRFLIHLRTPITRARARRAQRDRLTSHSCRRSPR
jgi:hypothetical protein